MGHQFSDLDSVGASIGLWSAITKGQEKPCYVVLNREQTLAGALVETVEKAGNTGMFLSPREALSLITDRSLLIIVDTHSESFVESRDLYKYSKRTVVIDHHRMMVKHIENAINFLPRALRQLGVRNGDGAGSVSGRKRHRQAGG